MGLSNKLGELLKQEMKRQRMRQKELAKAIGVSGNTISQIFTGATTPSAKTLDAICDVLNVEPVVYLIAKPRERRLVSNAEAPTNNVVYEDLRD